MRAAATDNWIGLQLRHLAAFRAVVAEQSFSRAAERLGYTQSAISQQIRALERIVGHRLLNRQIGSNKVSLTIAGERLVVHADRVLGQVRSAEADLEALSGGDLRSESFLFELAPPQSSRSSRRSPKRTPSTHSSWRQ